MNRSLKQVLLFYSIVFGILYVPLVLWLSHKSVLAPIQLFTTDTFYYLSIARHSFSSPFFTSDGIYPTNGFHPQWGYLLTALFSLPAFASQLDLQMYLTLGLSLTFTTVGMAFFGMTVYHLTENAAISLLASVPGFYYLIFAPLVRNYNSTWSYINGMESPLSIFWFGLFLFLVINKDLLRSPSPWSTVLASVILTLVIFSRLDDVFLLLPFWALIYFYSRSKKQPVVHFLIAVLIPLTALAAYMLYNYSYTGSAMPVSGLIKNGNWLPINLVFFITSFFPIQIVDYDPIWAEASMRSLQTVIPALAATGWIILRWKSIKMGGWQVDTKDARLIISVLAVYMIVKGGYNFVLVYLMGQGHWYYSISIMIFNLMAAIILAPPLNGISSQRQRAGLGVAALLGVILWGNAFVEQKIQSQYNAGYYELWLQREAVNAELTRLAPDLKVVEYDDGVIAYFLDAPAMNGFGFTLDKEAAQAQTEGRLLETAYQRGFQTIAVMSYINFPPDLANDSNEIREQLREMPGIGLEDLDAWQFEFLYRDEHSSIVFIKYEPLKK